MPEATSNHTTVPTRRRFLSHAAGVTAGGAVLALAAVSATADAAAPMAALAPCDPDPIFALIEEYRAAARIAVVSSNHHFRARLNICVDDDGGPSLGDQINPAPEGLRQKFRKHPSNKAR